MNNSIFHTQTEQDSLPRFWLRKSNDELFVRLNWRQEVDNEEKRDWTCMVQVASPNILYSVTNNSLGTAYVPISDANAYVRLNERIKNLRHGYGYQIISHMIDLYNNHK